MHPTDKAMAELQTAIDAVKNAHEESHEIIGWLVGGSTVVCDDCAIDDGVTRYVELQRVNIGAYRQTCHRCGSLLVKGRTDAWPELFQPMYDTTSNVEVRRTFGRFAKV